MVAGKRRERSLKNLVDDFKENEGNLYSLSVVAELFFCSLTCINLPPSFCGLIMDSLLLF